MRHERGFTLIEVAVATVLFAIVVTLGAAALRHYWLVQSLEGAANEVVTQLRQLHTRSASESHPRIYGARFREDASEWDIVLYDAQAGTCTRDAPRRFGGGEFQSGVVVSAVSFTGEPEGTATCVATGTAEGWAEAGDQFVFFYPRGSATDGSVTLRQPILDRTRTVRVRPMTGRVSRI